MDHLSVFVILLSLYHNCHGSIGGLPYGIPTQKCENVSLDITSTMFVTVTEQLPAITNTRVMGQDTSFKPMPLRTSTVTTSTTTLLDPFTVTVTQLPAPCETNLDSVTVIQTIPVYVTTYLKPIRMTKQSKMMVWMTVPPVTKTVVVTSTEKEEPKLKIMVVTNVTTTILTSDTITMTMPIVFTDLLAPLTSTIHDYNVHTVTLPASTTTLTPDVIMKNASTVTSTVLITHTEQVAPDTKLVTWTITQTVSTCTSVYNYPAPQVPFIPPVPSVPFLPGVTLVTSPPSVRNSAFKTRTPKALTVTPISKKNP